MRHNDDIDWANASSDFGLVQLCREMATLASPVTALAHLAPRRRRPKSSTVRTGLPEMASALSQLELA